MIIRRIRLVNFRKYSELELEFPEGLIGIVGRNGAGKTTILEAVGFALYGASASRSRGKGVRRDNCPSTDSCIVELDFAIGGDSYSIVRELRGANEQQTAKMYKGNQELIAHQARGIETMARRLLGLDYPTFIRSIFARQKELALLSDERPEERRRAVRRMIGIERIERAYKLAREDKRSKEEFIKGAQAAIADLEAKTQELEQLQPQVVEARVRLAAAEKEVERGENAVEVAKKTLSIQEEKRRQYTEADKKLGTLQERLSGTQRRQAALVEDLSKAKDSRRRSINLRPKVAAFERTLKQKERFDKAQGKIEERRTLDEEIASLENRIERNTNAQDSKQDKLAQFADLDRRLKAAPAVIRAAETDLKQKNLELDESRSELDQNLGLAKQIAENTKRVRKEGAKGHCPTCLRPLGENLNEIMAHFKDEKTKLEGICSELKERVSVLGKAKVAAEKELQARRNKKQQLSTQKQSREVLRAESRAIRIALKSDKISHRKKQRRLNVLNKVSYDKEKHRRVEAELVDLGKTRDEAIEFKRDASRIPTLHQDLKRSNKELASLSQEIKVGELSLKKIGFDSSAYEQAKLSRDKAVEQWQKHEKQAAAVREELGILNDRSKRLGTEITEKRKLKKRIEGDEETIRYLTQLEYVLKDFQADLISRIRPLIAQRAGLLLDQVTEGRYSVIELDEDYTISIVDDGVSHPIKRYSGGEEDLFNLCLRIAISQVIAEQIGGAGSGLIALDEVFGSQDRERRERLIRAMQSLSPLFRQILFITHVEDLQERVPNVLHVSEDPNRNAVARWLN